MVQKRVDSVKALVKKPDSNLSEAEMVRYRIDRMKTIQKSMTPGG